MRGAKYWYLRYESEGDQYVGHYTTGKDQIYKICSLSSYQYNFSHIDDLGHRLATKQSIKYWLRDRLPGTYQIYPETFEVAMVYLFFFAVIMAIFVLTCQPILILRIQ